MLILSFLSCFHTYGDYQDLRWELLDQDGDGYIWDRFPEEDGDDCDDFNADVHPGKAETPYNNIDDDCDSETPDDDLDGDGYGIETDCDDNSYSSNPGQTEIAYTGIDEDCDSQTLDDDLDQDGYPLEDDCDDNNYNVRPDMTEQPYNQIDDDCNPSTPDDDLDSDGYGIDSDCDDSNPTINPGVEEIYGDGVDQDCSGFENERSVIDIYGTIMDPESYILDGTPITVLVFELDSVPEGELPNGTSPYWASSDVFKWKGTGSTYQITREYIDEADVQIFVLRGEYSDGYHEYYAVSPVIQILPLTEELQADLVVESDL
jgi:hypothetical protein